MDDQAIIELYNARNEDAVRATDEQYGRYCRATALRILHDSEDTEECVSEAYLRVWNAIPPASPADFKLFLGKIVRRVALHVCEKRIADKRGGGEYAVALDELHECLPSSATPDDVTDSLVIRQALDRFLDTLPLKEKTVFLRRYWYLDSVSDIAKRLHTTDNHIYVMLHRTRQKLRTILEKEGIAL